VLTAHRAPHAPSIFHREIDEYHVIRTHATFAPTHTAVHATEHLSPGLCYYRAVFFLAFVFYYFIQFMLDFIFSLKYRVAKFA